MNEIKKSKYFKYKKYCDYTSMSLTDLIFENLNFKNENSIVSFFRCDFRGSSFKNVHFYKNIFDRADFISCTFILAFKVAIVEISKPINIQIIQTIKFLLAIPIKINIPIIIK